MFTVQLSVVKPKPKLLLWPITTDEDNPINQLEREASAVKRVRVSHDWVCYYFRLIEKVKRDILANRKAKQCKTKAMATLHAILN